MRKGGTIEDDLYTISYTRCDNNVLANCCVVRSLALVVCLFALHLDDRHSTNLDV
jgi:hypothetical protein